ncbi:MAG: hypothetical protein CMJ94_15550 [Planctomycetes bacterium]|nr:hypothetical protein [Planctomycetota bacterium]
MILNLVLVAALAQQEAPPVQALTEPQIVRNLRYAEMDGVEAKFHTLDLATPGGEGPHPVLVMIHGGGWRLGDKANRSMWKDKLPYFREEGWVYITINYRLTNGEGVPPHPAHVEDVAAALAWVHDHVAEYGGDPDRLFIMGHSAGAHLAALVATDARRLAKYEKPLSMLKGVVCLDTAGYDIAKYLGTDLAGRTARAIYTNAFGFEEEGWKDASPQHFVRPGAGIPPMLIFHTKERREVAHLSQAFVAALRQAKVPAAAIYAADKNHGGINACIGQEGDPYTALIRRFLADPHAANTLKLASMAPVQELKLGGATRVAISVLDGTPEGLPVSAWRIATEVNGVEVAVVNAPRFTSPHAMQTILQHMVEVVAETDKVELKATLGPEDAWLDLDGPVTRITWQRLEPTDAKDELVFTVLPRPEQQ